MFFKTEYMSYVGGLCFCVHSIPQMHKVYKTKSANYISYLSLLTLAGGLSSTLLLSVQNNDPFLYVPYGIGLMHVNILIFMKQYYDDGMLLKTLPRRKLNRIDNISQVNITGSESYSSNDDESMHNIDEVERKDKADDIVSNKFQINL
jgi:uncharacterized protein with PQ loop repeat